MIETWDTNRIKSQGGFQKAKREVRRIARPQKKTPRLQLPPLPRHPRDAEIANFVRPGSQRRPLTLTTSRFKFARVESLN